MHGELDGLAELATSLIDIPLRLASLLGIGSVPVTELAPAAKDAWVSLASDWYSRNRSAASKGIPRLG